MTVQPYKTRRTRRSAGFSLLEILIVLALIGMLAALVISNLDKILGSGQEEVARVFVNESMVSPLMSYRINVGRYPTTEEGLDALLNKPGEGADNWKGPYVKSLPEDPWGQPYQYRFPGEKNPDSYDLWSFGPDGVDSDQNIGNWQADSGENP